MFHGKKILNAHVSEDEKEKGNHSKTKPKKKAHSKQSHSKKKKWDDRLKSSTLKCGNYESEFVGAKRLTKCVGFLAKGKISDSISRLEKNMPDGVRARTKQDLLNILQFSKDSDKNVSLELTNHNISSQNEMFASSSSSSYCSPTKQSFIEKNEFSYSLKAPDSKFSSISHHPKSGNSKRSEFSICREIILSRLYSAAKEVNKNLFPGISNLDRIKKEFLNTKREYNAARQTLSSSNNCESSQETLVSKKIESSVKQSFKLNPVLTEEIAVPKDLESMFPSSQDSSSGSDIQVLGESDLQNKLIPGCCAYKSEFSSNSDRVRSLPLRPCSSVSSTDSPVWKPDISPVKFVPDFPPTPKLYYRQKMF